MDLEVFWFLLLGVLLAGYAILDGFDLGVGILHPLARGDEERRLVMNSIGPLWDGNEVWLVTFGGALFAAFPEAYATIFSSFHLPFTVVLLALIGRATSIELRSKTPSKWWRTYWDLSFSFSSAVAVFLYGVAAGNIIQGIPVGADLEYAGDVFDLLSPYPIMVGVLALCASAMHGALFLRLKVEGELGARVEKWGWPAFGTFLAAYMIVTIWTLAKLPHAIETFERWPAAWLVIGFSVLSIAAIPRALLLGQPRLGFLCSSLTMASLVFALGMAIFPHLVLSSLGPEGNLDIYRAASSESTLRLMRTIAFIGLPFVLTYTGLVYWIFRGKTRLDTHSY